MKKSVLFILLYVIWFPIYSQESEQPITESVLRFNLVNPGVEYEAKISQESTIAFNLGAGYGGSYKELTTSASGWLYMYSPFVDVQFKHFHNLESRIKKGRNITYNSGNFLGVRFLTRGKAFDSNFYRTSDYDFAVGPMWGLQRSYSRVHILFDIGVNYYFDGKGNGGITPMVELNIGYNLFSK